MTEERSDDVAPETDPPAGDGEQGHEDTVESLRAALEQATAQRLRAAADYQNLQRRAAEERAEFGRYQLTASVLNFLPVLDDLERAVESEHEAIKDHPWVEGVNLVMHKFRSVLESAGVTEVHALNQLFDPAKHEAVGSAPGPDGTVVRVLRRGYQLNDKVLRAAMVLVGDGDRAASQPPTT
ncbi:MAG: nucleotide exchange factor GrpE [Chloroflexi bacterium]|nr:MAG: nucleotide exchange factor GrpE [Chloroflexota bacterium]